MSAPVGLVSVQGGDPAPYTVAEEEKTMFFTPCLTITFRTVSRPPMLFS